MHKISHRKYPLDLFLVLGFEVSDILWQ